MVVVGVVAAAAAVHVDDGRKQKRSVPRDQALLWTNAPLASGPLSRHHVFGHDPGEFCLLALALVSAEYPAQNVEFLNNPAKFSDVYRFRVTFECIAPLKDGKKTLRSHPNLSNARHRPGMEANIRVFARKRGP